jgi:Cu(I)/Ag(I) efflux system membrane fusion protein
VPSEALIRTGQRTLVMLAEAEGAFRPVVVKTAQEAQGMTAITAGLQEGQQVVVSGQFLIDSEASLKGIEARLATPARYRTRARITGIDLPVVTLEHPDIPELEWPAMIMDFELAAPLLDAELHLQALMQVAFELRDGELPLIVELAPASGPAGAP